MSIFDDPAVKQHLANLERTHNARQQRKLNGTEITTVRGVDFPAKTKQTHSHRTDAQYVQADAATTDWLVSEAGFTKDACGCAFQVTPESVAKAEGEQFQEHLSQLQKAADSGAWPGMLTADQVKFLMGGKLPEA